MSKESNTPTASQMLAGLVNGSAQYAYVGMTVQRSHRFPVGIFLQIENLASISKVPVSTVINLLIESGLETVKAQINPDLAKQLSHSPTPLVERYSRPAGKKESK